MDGMHQLTRGKMISFYGEKTYECKVCGEANDKPFSGGLCSKCMYKDLVSKVNSLCDGCRKKCKQTELISIAKCPDYTPKVSFKVPSKPAELSFTDSGVNTGKKPKKALKQTKRKK